MPYGRKKRGKLTPHQSSLVLNLQPILAARGFKNQYSFLVKSGVLGNSAANMLKGKAVQINMRQLTAICTALNCTPNDIFARRQMTGLPESHALNALPPLDAPPLPTVDEWLRGKSFEEIKRVMGVESEQNDGGGT